MAPYPSSDSESSCSFDSVNRQQNRTLYKNLAMACDRFSVSNRAAAAIASATLKDHGHITNEDNSLIIDRSKLRRERTKFREKNQAKV